MHRLLIALLVLVAAPAFAQEKEKLSSNDLETRTVLAFKVSDAAVQKMLPSGWEINPPAAGPSKGANLILNLINQTMTQDPDGKPLPARTYIVLAAPAKKAGTDVAVGMVLLASCPTKVHPAPTVSMRRRKSPLIGDSTRNLTARPLSVKRGKHEPTTTA